jgi:putative membrane protein
MSTSTETQAETPEVPWRRLDRRMLAIRPLQVLWRSAVPLAVLILYPGRGSGQEWYAVGGAVLLVLAGVAHWFTTRYRIGPAQVELVTGLLRRRRLAVPLDRIRGVDVTATLLHRLLGVAVVKVGTGGHERRQNEDLALDAVSAVEAVRLRGELLHRRDVAQAHDVPAAIEPVLDVPETVIARFDPRWLRYAPFTLSGLVTAAAAVGFAANLANEAHLDVASVGPLRAVVDQLGTAPLVVVALVAAIVLLVAISVLSVAGYVVAYWNFSLTRHPGGTVHVHRGLLTTRAVSLEERRLRGVEISEPLLLRAVHGGRATAIATGNVGTGGGAGILLPPAPVAEAHRVAAEVLQSSDVTTAPLRRHGPAARRRRYTRALLPAAAVVLVLFVLGLTGTLPTWPAQVALLALPVAALLAADRYRNLGHTLTDRFLVGRSGSVARHTFALRRDGIVGWRLHQSFFQRRAGVLTAVATTAGGRSAYAVLDVDTAAGVQLADEAVPGLLTPFLVRKAVRSVPTS